MDPLESMSTGGPLPKNFDAENAGNMEDVRLVSSYAARGSFLLTFLFSML